MPYKKKEKLEYKKTGVYRENIGKYCRMYGEKVVRMLWAVASGRGPGGKVDKRIPAKARIMAAQTILAYGYGRPEQKSEVVHTLTDMTDYELEELERKMLMARGRTIIDMGELQEIQKSLPEGVTLGAAVAEMEKQADDRERQEHSRTDRATKAFLNDQLVAEGLPVPSEVPDDYTPDEEPEHADSAEAPEGGPGAEDVPGARGV